MTAEPLIPLPAPAPWPGTTVGMNCQLCGRPSPCPAHPAVGKATVRP